MEHSCTNRRHGTQAHTKEKRYTGTHIRRRGKHRHIQRHDTQGFDPISMLHSTILDSQCLKLSSLYGVLKGLLLS